jgi:hypothetical protein
VKDKNDPECNDVSAVKSTSVVSCDRKKQARREVRPAALLSTFHISHNDKAEIGNERLDDE